MTHGHFALKPYNDPRYTIHKIVGPQCGRRRGGRSAARALWTVCEADTRNAPPPPPARGRDPLPQGDVIPSNWPCYGPPGAPADVGVEDGDAVAEGKVALHLL